VDASSALCAWRFEASGVAARDVAAELAALDFLSGAKCAGGADADAIVEGAAAAKSSALAKPLASCGGGWGAVEVSMLAVRERGRSSAEAVEEEEGLSCLAGTGAAGAAAAFRALTAASCIRRASNTFSRSRSRSSSSFLQGVDYGEQHSEKEGR
jgi:hypothetical protein